MEAFVCPHETRPSLARTGCAKGSAPGDGRDEGGSNQQTALLTGSCSARSCDKTHQRGKSTQGHHRSISTKDRPLPATPEPGYRQMRHLFAAETSPTFSSSAVSIAIARRHRHFPNLPGEPAGSQQRLQCWSQLPEKNKKK